jgi:hypothetical protein
LEKELLGSQLRNVIPTFPMTFVVCTVHFVSVQSINAQSSGGHQAHFIKGF